MPATIAGSHLGPDTHANRPAANASGQPVGALYSCTTHGLIYKTDGSTWSTYATLGSGSLSDQGVVTYFDFTTAAAPSAPAAGKIRVYSKTGDALAQKTSAGVETIFGAGGGGGSFTQAFVGYNTVGGTTETPGVNSKLYFKKVTLANACLLTSIDAYVGTSGAGTVSAPCAAVYDDNAGSPGKVIAYATEFNTISDMGGNFRWLAMPIGAWLTAADYWLAIRTSDSGASLVQLLKYDVGTDQTGTGVLNSWKDASLYTLSNSSRQFSIRANTIR